MGLRQPHRVRSLHIEVPAVSSGVSGSSRKDLGALVKYAVLGVTAFLAAQVNATPSAMAQNPASATGWQFAVAPYIWAAGIKGEVATLPPAPAVDIDVGFSDILKNLNIAFMGLAEIHNGRFSVLLDLTYTRLEAKSDTPGPLFSDAKLTTIAAFATLTGGYRVISLPQGFLEPFVGGRLWYVDTKIKLGSGLLASRKGSDDEVWFDPIIGIRARANLGSGFFVSGYFDFGGYGVGSDVTWQAYGGLGYEFSSSWSVFGGYRYLSVDYDRNGFVYDIEQHGPMTGVIYRF